MHTKRTLNSISKTDWLSKIALGWGAQSVWRKVEQKPPSPEKMRRVWSVSKKYSTQERGGRLRLKNSYFGQFSPFIYRDNKKRLSEGKELREQEFIIYSCSHNKCV